MGEFHDQCKIFTTVSTLAAPSETNTIPEVSVGRSKLYEVFVSCSLRQVSTLVYSYILYAETLTVVARMCCFTHQSSQCIGRNDFPITKKGKISKLETGQFDDTNRNLEAKEINAEPFVALD